MKNRKELIKQQEMLLKTRTEVESDLMKIPGVIKVGIGLREKGGEFTKYGFPDSFPYSREITRSYWAWEPIQNQIDVQFLPW